MKLICEGFTRVQHVGSITAGIRVREIRLDRVDMEVLASMSPEQIGQWALRLNNRFPPISDWRDD